MVRVTDDDLAGDTDLLQYLSSDSEADLDNIATNDAEAAAKFAELIPEVSAISHEFPNVLIIGNLPTPHMDRYEKMRNAIKLRVSRVLPNITSDDFEVDVPKVKDEAGLDKGCGVGFITFKKSKDKTVDMPAAVEILNTVGMDAKFMFRVSQLDDFDAILKEPEYIEFPADSVAFYRDGFRDWLADSLGREQFAYRASSGAEIMWFDGLTRTPEIVCKNHQKFGVAFCWSPQGSYFVTVHRKGVWIRADNDFAKKRQFQLQATKHVLFSPDEEYLIGWDGTIGPSDIENRPPVIIWEVYTGRKLCTFPTPIYAPSGVKVEDGGCWPFFLFSPDSKYFAVRKISDLVVYETSTVTPLVEPKSSEPGAGISTFSYPLEQFQWCPTDNLLSIWIPEIGDAPGRLLIVEIPSRQEVASKNVFSVKSVSMHWHPQGEFLALNTVIMRKMSKKVKKEVAQIEVFRVKEKSVPVDIVDLEGFRVRCLHWEKSFGASRFATLTTNESCSGQFLSFFDVPMKNSKQDTKLVQSLPVPTMINTFAWSPAGQYFLAASRNSEGTLIFGVINEQNKAEVIQKDEHMDLTTIQWDPSGRYVTTAVLVPPGDFRLSATSEFRIYSFLGKLLYRFQNQECMQFFWRPRPPSMLSRQKLEDIGRRLKEYSKRYDSQDESRRQARQQALKEEGSGLMAKYLAACQKGQDYLKSHPRAKEWADSWKRLNDKMDWKDEVTEWEEMLEVTREKVVGTATTSA